MKVYRYMSALEKEMYDANMKMIPFHMHHGAETTSTGFCFLPEVVVLHRHDRKGRPIQSLMSPEESLSFLGGIVTEDFLLEFEASADFFRKTKGTYLDPYDGRYLMEIDELCCDTYNKKTLKLLRYGVVDGYESVQWKTV